MSTEPLPSTPAEYDMLLAQGRLHFKACVFCDRPHHGRTHTRAGWRETQLSGSCEDCFDELFKSIEEE